MLNASKHVRNARTHVRDRYRRTVDTMGSNFGTFQADRNVEVTALFR